jgi:hypothetical protein
MDLKYIIRIIIPVLFLNLFACQPEEEAIPDGSAIETEVENYLIDAEEMGVQFNQRIPDDIVTCSTSTFEIPLVSWPHNEIGKFTVDNSLDYLIVYFELDPSNEWYFQQTQLIVEVSENKENPNRFRIKSRKYLFTVRHEKGTRNYMYQIPMEKLKLTKEKVEKCVTLTGIARVDNGYFRWGKFAIAENNEMGNRNYWKSWLHEYCLAECTPPATSAIIDCATAWMEGISYQFNSSESGYYGVFASEMDNKFVPLSVTDPASGQKINVGEVKILFWGSSDEYDLFIEFMPLDGYDIQDANIYVGILDPLKGPDAYKNRITFTDQNSLVFKMRTDYQPVYLAIAATVCTEKALL